MPSESELRNGLGRGELSVHYQPLVDASSATVVGFEALARWGEVPPAAFVPLAEGTGLIHPLGEWVLREVCGQVRAWLDAGHTVPRVYVNVSALQFRRPGLAELFARETDGAGIPRETIGVEITESCLLEDPTSARSELASLRSLGVLGSLDDFGVGYSSLVQLKHLPVNTLKIDKSFVSGVAIDERDEAIVAAIVILARAMGLGVVAEGVEDERQLKALRLLGCRVMQGFYFSRPLRSVDAGRVLRDGLPERSEARATE